MQSKLIFAFALACILPINALAQRNRTDPSGRDPAGVEGRRVTTTRTIGSSKPIRKTPRRVRVSQVESRQNREFPKPAFIMTVDERGRSACSAPNLQQRTELQALREFHEVGLDLDVDFVLDSYRSRAITLKYSRVPSDAKDAIRAAVNIWEDHLLIPEGFTLKFFWDDFEGLAYAKPSWDEDEEAEYYKDDDTSFMYDRFIWNWEDGDLLEMRNGSGKVYDAVTGSKLFWGAPWMENSRGERMKSVEAHGGWIMLQADPNPEFGGRVSHLDPDAFPYYHRDGIMRPYGRRGGSNHKIGPVTLGMLYDIGWELKDQVLELQDVLRCLEGR